MKGLRKYFFISSNFHFWFRDCSISVVYEFWGPQKKNSPRVAFQNPFLWEQPLTPTEMVCHRIENL